MSRGGRAKSEATRPAPGRGRALGRFLLLLVAIGAGWLTALLIPDPLRPSADAMVPRTVATQVRIAAFSEAGGGIEVAPAGDVTARTLFVLYPGGLVRPHAYTWIGVGLAPLGIRTVIPTMPLDLAVFGRDRADRILDHRHEGEERIVVGGHSLGGAMAAAYAERNPERLDGLVLMGAYPPENADLSGLELATLVLAAEHDGLSTLDEIRDGMARLPGRAGIERIDGAVHAFFGRYGPQRGDGLPTVPRQRAEDEILNSLEAFLTLMP